LVVGLGRLFRRQGCRWPRHSGEFSLSDMLDVRSSWLSEADLAAARERLPLVYVDAVPVRVDGNGQVTQIGLLLRGMPDGSISRAVVSGRVLYGELVRDALLRHLEKDLGPMALPRVPASPQPFTIVEYFPEEARTGFHDPRQHAVALAYVVPIDGDCAPSQDSLDLVWVTPMEAANDSFQSEMSGGQGRLVRMALAHCGLLP
jgi:ADP-ribose pyrophosphatase YjhB (NUDIX family)